VAGIYIPALPSFEQIQMVIDSYFFDFQLLNEQQLEIIVMPQKTLAFKNISTFSSLIACIKRFL
jgi:hypothetical protein